MITRLKELLFQNRGAKQTIVKNVFWLSVGQIGSRLIRAAIIIYAARVLGAAEYGIFSYVLGLAGFFTLFADVGVNSILTKNIANYPERRSALFSTSFWIKVALLLITALLIIFVAPYFTDIEKATILIPFVALLVIFDGLRDFSISFLRGLEKMEWEALIVIIMNITIVVAGFVILNISPTSKSLIFSYIASVGAAAFLAIFILKNQFLKIFRYFNKNLFRQILKSCWPIAFSGVLGAFMLNTDIIMLGWWRTVEEIGYYSAGQRIVGLLYTLPVLLASGIFPALSRLVKQGEQQKAKTLNEKSITAVFFVVIPLVIGGIILSHSIIDLIFGKEYLPTIPAFQILIINSLLIFPGTLIYNLVLAHNQQKRIIRYVAAGALGNIVFNALLIPVYGIVGSAIATIAAYFLYYGLTWRWMKKITDFQIFCYLKKIIPAAIIMGIFSFTLDKIGINVIINIIVSTGIYFGLLYVLKEKILEEIKPIVLAIKK